MAEEVTQRILNGDVRALARAASWVEDRRPRRNMFYGNCFRGPGTL